MNTTLRRLSLAAVTCLMFATSTAAAADELSFRPALFGTGEASIVNLVSCPAGSVGEPLIWVFCQGQVRDDGSVRQAHCIADGPFHQFRAAALDGFRRARFEPAIVDGTPVSVYASFRLAFQLHENDCAVTAIPNKGFHVTNFGLAYVEPQEIIEDRRWQSRRMNTTGTRGRSSGTAFTVSAAVAADGTASDAKVEQLNFGNRRDAANAARTLGSARFIPGFVDGAPAPMRSYEFFYVDPEAVDIRADPETPGGGGGRGVP
jgi:hypothetical protein